MLQIKTSKFNSYKHGIFVRILFFDKHFLYNTLNVPHNSPFARESNTVLDSGFQAVDSGFQVLDSSLCLNLDSRFLNLVGLRIPNAAFRDSLAKFSREAKTFPERRNPDPLHDKSLIINCYMKLCLVMINW